VSIQSQKPNAIAQMARGPSHCQNDNIKHWKHN